MSKTYVAGLIIFVPCLMLGQETAVSFNPSHGSVEVRVTSNIIVTFSQPVRKIDDTVLDNDIVDGTYENAIVTLSSQVTWGDTAIFVTTNFDASINDEKTVITIDPNKDFYHEQIISVTVVEQKLENYYDVPLQNVGYNYQNRFKTEDIIQPSPFDLVYPFNDSTIVLSRDNFLDTLYFAWDASEDKGQYGRGADSVIYRRELTGDLSEYIRFIVPSNDNSIANMYKVPYHHIEDYMHTAGVELISGTWNIIATDGKYDVSATNGPFTLTIDGSKLNVNNSEPIPKTFALHANYPNPFNPTTIISYDLPEQAQVTLGIYDLLGKQIKTLVNQSQDAGNKIAVWDGSDEFGRPVSAGVYLYQIQADDFSQTRKMLLLK